MVHTHQIEDNHRKEHHHKSAGENEQILRLESLELDGIARTFYGAQNEAYKTIY